MKVKATKVYTINWDGDNQGYIRVANDLHTKRHTYGLDSLDLGDATGAILEWAEAPDNEGRLPNEHTSCFFTYEGQMLSVSFDWDNFEYPERGEGPELYEGNDLP